MISTTYQPYIALILCGTGVGIYILCTIISLLSRHVPVKWLKVVVEVMMVLSSYLIVAVVVYIHDSGRLRLYTPLCVVGGMMLAHLVKKISLRRLNHQKVVDKSANVSHNSRGD